MRIQPYDSSHKTIWDDFVRNSKNGTFLLRRDYMDYHCDRFLDCSLLVWDGDGKLVALFPAHREGTVVSSHRGLTFGGFITDHTIKVPRMLESFDAVMTYYRERGVTQLLYKTIPHIYTRLPAEEDRYALFLAGARLVRRGVIAAVENPCRLAFQERRSRGVKKAIKNGLRVIESEDFASFWQILAQVLMETYGTRPVHTVQEISLLHSRFPENIHLYSSYQDTDMLAGVVVYESERVARAQYIAASEMGRSLGSLDHIFYVLLNQVYCQKPYFDFGTSDEDDGHRLNRGLIDQKEGFGARAVVHDHYELDLAHYEPGQISEAML